MLQNNNISSCYATGYASGYLSMFADISLPNLKFLHIDSYECISASFPHVVNGLNLTSLVVDWAYIEQVLKTRVNKQQADLQKLWQHIGQIHRRNRITDDKYLMMSFGTKHDLKTAKNQISEIQCREIKYQKSLALSNSLRSHRNVQLYKEIQIIALFSANTK